MRPTEPLLRGTLILHAKVEEEALSPEWAKLVGLADAAVPMIHDHEDRREDRTARACRDRRRRGLAGVALRPLCADRVHFRKEEDIQLPAFDAAPPELTRTVLERMEALSGNAHGHQHWGSASTQRCDLAGCGRGGGARRQMPAALLSRTREHDVQRCVRVQQADRLSQVVIRKPKEACGRRRAVWEGVWKRVR
jgi:hypothetical protein